MKPIMTLKLGELLVNAGAISAANLQAALGEQKVSHMRLGEVLIKNGYLQQNSFTQDSYSPPEKGFEILDIIITFHTEAMKLIRKGIPISLIKDDDSINAITHLRELASDDEEGFLNVRKNINNHLKRVASERTKKIGDV